MTKKTLLLFSILAINCLPIYALQDHSKGFTVTQIALDAEAVREQIKIEEETNSSNEEGILPDENQSEGGNTEQKQH